MPIDSVVQVAIEASDKPFNRLALRCSMQAVLNSNALASGSISLHATRYRKFARDTLTVIDCCGHDGGEKGYSGIKGDAVATDELIQALARRCRNYVLPQGTSASVSLNFAWRKKQGDLTGMLHLEVIPGAGGDPIKVLSGDLEEDRVANPALDDFLKSIFAAIKNRSDGLGW